MQRWRLNNLKNTDVSPYVWVIFCILPFYFIFGSSSSYEIAAGIAMILGFFLSYVFAAGSKGRWVYVWTGLQIVISILMTVIFGYVYFALFLAFFIGNIQHPIGFVVLYTIHLISTIATVNVGFVTQNPIFITQLPFVLLSLIGVILLPITTYNKNKQGRLQGQLEDANKRISELVKLEERQRIARDLHDTIGQKLSLIGLKSDLTGKLIDKQPYRARKELSDIQQTARSALKEVRELVTQMRGIRIEDELVRIQQILKAAHIELTIEGDPKLKQISLISENVVCMCLKEAVTNVIKHSGASKCVIKFEPFSTELMVTVHDQGMGLSTVLHASKGNGIRGMRERLEFVNGSLEIVQQEGTMVVIRVPNVSMQSEQEVKP
jgi:two-component system sensor histidine kinase DesK